MAAGGRLRQRRFPDIFIANTGRIRSITTTGTEPTDVTGRSGLEPNPQNAQRQAAWFDYDNDGLLDLVLSNYTLWTPRKTADTRFAMSSLTATLRCTRPCRRLYHNLGNSRFGT
jgi:hypothetical protein